MTEPDDHDPTTIARRRRLHGARCCSVTPPRVRWDTELEAVVCDSCERVYAPVLFVMDDSARATLIRAIAVARGCNSGTGRIVRLNRHAVRRWRIKMGLEGSIDNVVPYADPGPTAKDLTG